MAYPPRPLVVVGVLAVVLLFYLTGPFAARTVQEAAVKSNADARLARWIEAVTPPARDFMSAAFRMGAKPPILEKARPLVPFSPYPLGKPADSKVRRSTVATDIGFMQANMRFQQPLIDEYKYIPLEKNLDAFKKHKPKNYRTGPARPTYATILSTRNGTSQDPYFLAVLLLTHQVLWSDRTRSKDHPMTVFVTSSISRQQRDMLAGAGALVRELDLLSWEPRVEGVHDRFRDQFSKLNLWAKTEFSRILYLDADTHLMKNVDELFDLCQPQKCDDDQLGPDTDDDDAELCDYVFAGVEVLGSKGSINGGVLLLKPNEQMHKRLVQSYVRTDRYNNLEVDASFLGWQFGPKGPFPAQLLPRKYNGYYPQWTDEGKLDIVHAKIWALDWDEAYWPQQLWRPAYKAMVDFYDSIAFQRDREGQGEGVIADTNPDPKLSAAATGEPKTRAPPAAGARDNEHVRLQQGKGLDDGAVQAKQQKMLERKAQGRMIREDA